MNTFCYLPLLIFYALATYRLSLLISTDSLPWKIGSRFRAYLKREEKKSPALKKSDVAHGVGCPRCSSIWIAVPVAAFAYWHRHINDVVAAAGDVFLGAMALSACSILLNRIAPAK